MSPMCCQCGKPFRNGDEYWQSTVVTENEQTTLPERFVLFFCSLSCRSQCQSLTKTLNHPTISFLIHHTLSKN